MLKRLAGIVSVAGVCVAMWALIVVGCDHVLDMLYRLVVR